jgi:hypothetical protein
MEVPMTTSKDEKVQPARRKKNHDAKPKRFQIVKLEERIAPGIQTNHNETLVRDVG